MLAIVQLYRSAKPWTPIMAKPNTVDREVEMAVKRKFLQGFPEKLRQSLYIFVNDPTLKLLEYTCNAKLVFDLLFM